MNRQYLDPVFLGRYPDELQRDLRRGVAGWPAEDLTLIQQPIDFLGVNYYTRNVTRFDADKLAAAGRAGATEARDLHRDGLGGVPAGPHRHAALGQGALRQSALYITENGAAFYDPPVADDGRVDDPLRVDYLREHSARRPRRDRAGRRRARLLRLVAARQLRMVARLLQALRHRARRFRDAEAHAEGQRALLREVIASRGRVLGDPPLAGSSLAPPD